MAKTNARPKHDSRLLVVLDWLRYLLICILIGLLLTIFVVQRNAVQGSSMLPTLAHGDQLFVEKITKHFGGLGYGDIITLETAGLAVKNRGSNIIKRIIGKPGDLIEIKAGGVYRNEEKLLEPYLEPDTQTQPRPDGFNHIRLGENEYYVLGDNRAVSEDSRHLGPIPYNHIIGEVLVRFYPLHAFGRP